MDIWLTLILTVHVLVALAIIFLVLLQHGKGADMGAAFGSGSSGSLFGATGSANFLSRTTAALAAVFFLTSLGLAYVATHKPQTTGSSVMQGVTEIPAAAPRPVEDIPKPAADASKSATDVPKPATDVAKPATDVPKPANAPAGSKANEVPK